MRKELKKGCARVWNTRAFSLLLSSDLQHFVCVCAAAKERRGDERHKEINKTHTHTYNGEFLCRLHLQHIVSRPSIILVAHTAQSETRKNFVTTTDTHTQKKTGQPVRMKRERPPRDYTQNEPRKRSRIQTNFQDSYVSPFTFSSALFGGEEKYADAPLLPVTKSIWEVTN